MRKLPNIVTVVGALLGVVGVVQLSVVLLITSLFCDVLDGYLARKLDAVSAYGKQLDWTVDVLLAGALSMRIGGQIGAVLLVGSFLLQAIAMHLKMRCSGRSACTIIACGMILCK